MSKKFSFFFALVSVSFLCGCMSPDQAMSKKIMTAVARGLSQPAQPTRPLSAAPVQQSVPPVGPQTVSRSAVVLNSNVALGFVPIPTQPLTTEAWLEAFDLIKQNADFVLHHAHVDWEAFAQTPEAKTSQQIESLNFITGMAKRGNLNVLIVEDPLESNRENIDQKLPKSIGKNFGDSGVRQAYKNYALRIARDYQPQYMGLASEVNTYLKFHPEDAQNLILLMKETYSLVKQASPTTKITATFQYELMNGKADGTPRWQVIDELSSVLDVVAITTYPSPFFASPDDIPANYYTQLKSHTAKPVLIAESGWPTGGSAAFHGTPENQKRFVERMPQLIAGLDVKLWIWWFLHDWTSGGYADFFKTMGLITSDGKPKPSWAVWQQIASQSKKG